MADTRLDPNVTRVDTGAMREAASSIREHLKAIKAAQTELIDCQKRLSELWAASAEEEYDKALYQVVYNLIRSFNTYDFYPKDIDRFAEAREQADGTANRIAASIEQAHWDPLV